MELTPLKEYQEPDYPTQPALRARPGALRRLPRRWNRRGGVVSKMMWTLAGGGFAWFLLTTTGSFGCVMVLPPVYLTEDEARAVIEDEAKKAGFDFSERGRAVQGVDLPVTHRFAFLPSWGKPKMPLRKPHPRGETELDGWNPKHRVGYKFVYRREAEEWWKTRPAFPPNMSIYQWPFGGGPGEGKEVLAVFVDRLGARMPKVKPTPVPAEAAPAAPGEPAATKPETFLNFQNRRNAEDLRMQVREFVQWLEAQDTQ